MRAKMFICIFCSLCIALFGSCSSPPAESSSDTVSSAHTSETVSKAVSETASVSDTESLSDTENTVPVSTSEGTSDSAAAEITETSTSAAEASSSDTSESESVSDTEASVTVTASSAAAETAETSVRTETAAPAAETQPPQTAQKPKAEVVIPKINMPQASGEKVISGTNAEVDHSNADEGYISVLYTGSAAAGKVRIKCGDLQYDHDISPNVRVFLPLMDSGSYSVKVYEQLSGAKYSVVADGSFDAAIKSSTGMYLYPNKYVDFDSSSSCVKKAAEICAGETDDVEKIALIFTYITDTIVYDKALAEDVRTGKVTAYVPDPDRALAAGKGICYDYASLFAAMCRSQSIPTRLVTGYADPNIYHAWNEVYTDETGWITPELFLKKKGYNITDATFYAGNSDKEKIADYISDDGNYSAVYRY